MRKAHPKVLLFYAEAAEAEAKAEAKSVLNEAPYS